MKKSELIYDELQIYQDILNYQMTGWAPPELQYKKYRLKPTLIEKIKSKLAMKKFKRKLRNMTNEKQK